MRTPPAIAAALFALGAFADEVVSPNVEQREVGRFQVASVRGGTSAAQVKLDSMTGTTWNFCRKGAKGGWAWCKMGIKGPLTAGPVGRFLLVTSEGGYASLLLDTVSGRSWGMCDDPTPEKSYSWCAIED
jgi:hypothetical protein